MRSFTVKQFEMDCDDGPGIFGKAKLSGDVPIGNRGGINVRDDNGDTVFRVRGEVDGNRAAGTFRYFGTVPENDGTTSECDSRRQEWSARAG
jgi:hypothetical protein